MTGSTDSHESHADHPVSASILGLVLVAVFAALFAAMNAAGFDAMAATVAVALAAWTMFTIWVLDRD